MEDVCVILPSTSRNGETADGDQQSRISFFAVFDGHGGVNLATSASQELHRHARAAGLEKSSDAKSRRQAVAEGFQRTDTALLERFKQHQWQDGATCAAVWIAGDSVIVANLGDAKCVLGRMPPDGGDI
ncbi:g11719 [Coccomyxa elongata]